MEILQFVNDEHVSSIDNIFRWGMARTIKDENIAGHSWWVVMFSYLIANEFYLGESTSKNSLLLKVMVKAQTHDLDEIFSDDVSHDVKYNEFNGEQLKESISTYTSKMLNKKFQGMDGLLEAVKHTADTEFEEVIFAIVKLADWLACIKYVVAEVSMGNKSMESKLAKCVNKLSNHIDYTAGILDSNPMIEGFDRGFLMVMKSDLVYFYNDFWKNGKYSN